MKLLVYILFFTFWALPALAQVSHYDIEVSYEEATRTLVGFETVTFVNTGLEALSELYLFLYPNFYQERHPNADDSHQRKVYPVAFNPGRLTISAIEDEAGRPLPYAPDPLRGNTLIVVHLASPLAPQQSVRFSVRFTTSIPEKRGVFGFYKGLVTLQGAWHPYLPRFEHGKWRLDKPPPKSRFKVRISLKQAFQVAGSTPPVLDPLQPSPDAYSMESEALPFFSLSIGPESKRSEIRSGNIRLIYQWYSKYPHHSDRIQDVMKDALSFFLEQRGPVPSTHITIAQAYLYQDLTAIGSKFLYIGNRLFKVFPTLKRFHEASIAKGLFQLLWQEKRPDEESWVIEGLAGRDTDAFIRQRYGKTFTLTKWLKPIGFIPVVDQILYSENIPLRQVYFRETPAPVVSEDVRFFNNPPSESANIFSKLETLLGKTEFEKALTSYRMRNHGSDQKTSFRKTLFLTTGQDTDRLIDLWLKKRVEIDFELKEVTHRDLKGYYETSILIHKHGEGVEPLQIIAHEKNGSTRPFVWDGSGKDHRLVFQSPSGIEAVEIDPHKILNDPNRKNNRLPRRWKVLLDDFHLNYDFQTKDLSVRAGLLFQYLYDTENWLRFLFSHKTTGNKSHIAYTRTIRNNHLVTIGLTYETLEPTRTNRFKEEAGFFSLGYEFIFPDLPLVPDVVRRLTTTFPSFDVGLTFNQQFTGGVYENSLLVTLDFRRKLVFSNYHEIGARIFVGQSIGKLFENRRYALGGTNAMRGYSPLIFEGKNISLFSLEYRFPLFYDTDLNLVGLAHTHAWQGAIFTDAGMVDTSHNVFQVDRFKSDIGAGIRFFVDLFGVYPSVIRFDVAYPIDSPFQSEDKLHYYLNAGQAF